MAKKSKGSGERNLSVRVKTARGRKLSSTRWLQRQLNDPYVAAAKSQGYRSRAAFKLKEINDRFQFLKRGQTVLDLGAAPGGWCQVALEKLKSDGRVIGVDLQEMESVPGAELMQLDFLAEDALDRINEVLEGKVDVVMSDMAASSTGHKQTDHLKIMALCEAALEFACEILKPDGVFLAKVLQGGAERDLMETLRRDFKTVRHVKPEASRKDSSEMYVLATGFRGGE